MPRPPKRLFEVYDYIRVYKAENDGNSPTLEQIAEHMTWASTSLAWWAVYRLKDMGLLTIDDHRKIDLGGDYDPPQGKPHEVLRARKQNKLPLPPPEDF